MITDSRTGDGVIVLAMLPSMAVCGDATTDSPETTEAQAAISAQILSDAGLENLARQSYRVFATCNVNNKGALDPADPMSTGAWNRVKAATPLADHTMKAIARPNNDTLYVTGRLGAPSRHAPDT